GQNKHGLKKIKHALLSSQETTAHPVQAPDRFTDRCALPWKAACVSTASAVWTLRYVFTLSGVPCPAKSAVSEQLIGVKPVPLPRPGEFARLSKQLPEPTRTA
ncbi:hypothetical protein, partial [Nocardiopsis sp. NRRL B-16309]|uniref:hypothetical protein n=1 Tax=Nocardiopsis sp. NRRL B-16309 TaxID=1519494 RepID=UPI001E3B85FE